MKAAEGVPKREHRVHGTFGTIDLQIVGTEASIGIGKEVGCNHGMVQIGVEHPHVGFVLALNFDATQFGVPLVISLPSQGIDIEVAVVEFSLQVVFGTFGINS